MSPKPKPANDKPVADATETKQPVVRRTVFDLDSFDEIVIERPYTPEPAPTSIEDALARLGNSQSRLLQIVSDGLRAEQEKELRRLRPLDANGKPGALDLSTWTVKDEDTSVRVPYTGVPCDPKKVKLMVATIAKMAHGFSRDLTPEQRKAAKDAAKQDILTSEPMRRGLARNSAVTDEEESEE